MRFGVFDHIDDSGLPPAEHYAARLRLVEALDALRFETYHIAEHHGRGGGARLLVHLRIFAAHARDQRLVRPRQLLFTSLAAP